MIQLCQLVSGPPLLEPLGGFSMKCSPWSTALPRPPPPQRLSEGGADQEVILLLEL